MGSHETKTSEKAQSRTLSTIRYTHKDSFPQESTLNLIKTRGPDAQATIRGTWSARRRQRGSEEVLNWTGSTHLEAKKRLLLRNTLLRSLLPIPCRGMQQEEALRICSPQGLTRKSNQAALKNSLLSQVHRIFSNRKRQIKSRKVSQPRRSRSRQSGLEKYPTSILAKSRSLTTESAKKGSTSSVSRREFWT